jgi:hypothetical protein
VPDWEDVDRETTQEAARLYAYLRTQVRAMSSADRQELVAQLGEAFDPEPVLAAHALWRRAVAQGERLEVGGPGAVGAALAEYGAALGASHLILSDPDAIRPENLTRLARQASESGIGKLSPVQILWLVLAWLILIGIPLASKELPPGAQSVVSDEIGAAGLAVAVSAMIFQKRKR